MHNRASQMYIFHILKTSGSFTKAAKELGVSTSHVSKQLMQLESELNVQLVQRSTRNLTLTDAGVQFAKYCARLYLAIQNAEAFMKKEIEQSSRTLRIALPSSFATLHVIPLLDKLQSKFPEINFEINLCDHKVDMLDEDIHLWLTTHSDIGKGYASQKIADGHFILAATPEYIQAHSLPEHPQDLLDHNCVIYQNNDQWSFIKEDEKINIQVSGNYRVDLAEAVKDLVSSAHGIGYIATYLLTDEFATGKLLPLLTDWKVNVEMPVYAVYPRDKLLAERLDIRTVIFLLKENIECPAYWDAALAASLKNS